MATTLIQVAKEGLLILVGFYESDFEKVCVIGGENVIRANRRFCWLMNSNFGIYGDKRLTSVISRCIGGRYAMGSGILPDTPFLTRDGHFLLRKTTILFVSLDDYF
jgi:hypothetical protein